MLLSSDSPPNTKDPSEHSPPHTSTQSQECSLPPSEAAAGRAVEEPLHAAPLSISAVILSEERADHRAFAVEGYCVPRGASHHTASINAHFEGDRRNTHSAGTTTCPSRQIRSLPPQRGVGSGCDDQFGSAVRRSLQPQSYNHQRQSRQILASTLMEPFGECRTVRHPKARTQRSPRPK
jgi:hypothetical protein